jgi:23S rRNA pseudouridine2605 synthase
MPRRGGNAQAPAERVQKILASLGLASRREAEEWIRAGRVTVNGQAAQLGARARPGDQIRLDGRLVRQRAAEAPPVFLCHRSPGEPLASIVERLPRRAGKRFVAVSPMPRIDGALELVTADGTLAARLQRGVRSLDAEFSVRVRGELTAEQIEAVLAGQLDRGVRLQVTRCEAAGGEGANRWYEIVARGASGKDVRQLFERQGALVSRIPRTRLGPLALERRLARGHFRPLTSQELDGLLAVEAAAAETAAGGTE